MNNVDRDSFFNSISSDQEWCIQSIQAAETWDLDISKYKNMHSGLEKAAQLILGLGLDEEIIQFLQKTNDGKATLKDLNERVLSWIHDENLEQKIRVSFAKTK